ncbi:hypothetical protein GCM10009689_16910 [Brevibacterium antiquum]
MSLTVSRPSACGPEESAAKIDTAFLELNSSKLAGRVLRAQTANDFTQESCVCCWFSSSTINDTADNQGLDSEGESFKSAWEATKDQVLPSTDAIKDTTTEFVAVIDTSAFAVTLPPWQLRVCPRFV